MEQLHEAIVRDPLILGKKTYHQMTEEICKPVEGRPTNGGGWPLQFQLQQ
jgi:hypothetical protein